MALALAVAVFASVPAAPLQHRLTAWLREHVEVQVRFVTQSEHVDGAGHVVTVSVCSTEPTDRERDLQHRMDATP